MKVILWVSGLSYIILMLGMTLCLAITFAGCGGEGPTASKATKDGRVFVRNETPWRLGVSFFNEELGLVEDSVQAGETKDVGQVMLKGGTEVDLEVVGYAYDVGQHPNPIVNVKFTINGNVTIRITGSKGLGGVHMDYEFISG